MKQLILLLFLGISFATYSQRINIGESHQAPGHGNLQYWKTVSKSDYKKTLQGVITSRHVNDVVILNDSDYCIFVAPDDDYKYLLTNSKDRANCGENAGTMELEIRSDFPFASHFKVGDRISAFGWWVEDFGHSPCGHVNYPTSPTDDTGGKTELHPFTFLKAKNENVEKVFMGVDHSERFKHYVTHDNFPFARIDFEQSNNCDPALFGMNTIRIISNESESPINYVLEEKMMIDKFRNPQLMLGLPNPFIVFDIAFRTKIITAYDFHSVSIKPEFNLYDVPPSLYEWEPHRFYYGEYKRKEGRNLDEKFTISVVDNLDNTQGIKVDLNLSFKKSANVKYSKWKYEYSGITSTDVIEAEETTNHYKTINFNYNPMKGFYDSHWNVNIVASDNDKKYQPLIVGDGVLGNQRKLYSLGYDYTLIPIKLDYSASRLWFGVRTGSEYRTRPINDSTYILPMRFESIKVCFSGYVVSPLITKIHPSLGVKSVEYFVKVLSDYKGNPILNPTSYPLGSTPLSLQEATVTRDPANDNVTIAFKNFRSAGGLFPFYNNSTVTLELKVVSKVGEVTTYKENFHSESCLPEIKGLLTSTNIPVPRDFPSSRDISFEFLKANFIISLLERMKNPKVPKNPSVDFLKEWGQLKKESIEAEEIGNAEAPVFKEVLGIYLKLMQESQTLDIKLSITQNEIDTLRDFLLFANQVPDPKFLYDIVYR